MGYLCYRLPDLTFFEAIVVGDLLYLHGGEIHSDNGSLPVLGLSMLLSPSPRPVNFSLTL